MRDTNKENNEKAYWLLFLFCPPIAIVLLMGDMLDGLYEETIKPTLPWIMGSVMVGIIIGLFI